MSNFNFIGNFLGKKAQPKKDGHDMSNLEVSSAPFGTFVPVTCYPVVPNEFYNGHVSLNIQTAPMREDNFARMYSNLKAVYVPLDAIMRDYLSITNSARSTRKDSIYQFPVYNPVCKLSTILINLSYLYVFQLGCEQLSAISDLADYTRNTVGSVTSYFKGDVDLKDVLLAQNLSVGVAMLDFADVLGCNNMTLFIEKCSHICCRSGESIPMSMFRMLDSLGYGNFFPLIHDFVLKFGQLIVDSLKVTPRQGRLFVEFYELDQSLEYAFEQTFNQSTFNTDVSLLPLFAYQYYISLVERSNYRKASTFLITLDSIYNALNTGDGQIFDLQYWEDDQSKICLFFGNIYESDVFESSYLWSTGILSAGFNNELSLVYDGLDNGQSTVSDMVLLLYLFTSSSPLLEQDVFNTMQTSVIYGSFPYTSQNELQNNLVKAYAETSALYKLKQDLLRAGVRRDKQMQAIFGISDKSSLYEDIQVLDVSKTEIRINGLLNQAETDVAPLGQRASRGDGGNALHFKFESKDFGFIFIVQYFTTDLFYENFMVDRSLTLATDSWFNPDMNHLGLETVNSRHLSFMSKKQALTSIEEYEEGETLVRQTEVNCGFSARDWHLKQRVNKTHGLFTNFAFDTGTSKNSDKYVPSNLMRGNAYYGGYVPTVIDQQTDLYSKVQDLYYNPFMVNNLFAVLADSFAHSDFSYDYFRCAWRFDIHKVSPMPKLGLFKLDV